MRKSLQRWSIAFLVPGTVLFCLIVIYPVVRTLQYSFTNWSGVGPLTNVGFANYINLWADPVFISSLVHTFLIMIGTMVIQIPLGFILASLISKKLRGYKFFRTVFFIPVVLSTVVIAELWIQIYQPQYGIVNALLRAVGLASWVRPWLGDVHTALWSVIAVVGWEFVGLYMIIFLSALQRIPATLTEAAELDGAVGWSQTRYITLPLMFDTFKLAMILLVTGSVQYFNLIYLMTNGGPANSTSVLASYMFRYAFQENQLGYASAVAGFMLVVSLVLAIGLQILFRREPIELA